MPHSDPEARRAYNRRYHLARYHQRRADAIEQLGGACVVCGVTEDLEIDHIDRETKSFDISKMWSVSMARYQAELAKCQLLCADHHLEKTLAEVPLSPCGTFGAIRRGCKCEVCLAFRRRSERERRARAKV